MNRLKMFVAAASVLSLMLLSVPAMTFAAAAPSVSLKVTNNPRLGSILTTAQGMTLYTFKNDKPDVSNCTGACASLWHPLTVAQGRQPTIQGMQAMSNLGVFKRPDGTYQVAIDGMPLYLYSGDTMPGQINGQDFKNLWWVVPTSEAGPVADWMKAGFTKVLARQEFMPGKAATIHAGAYTVTIPANAFDIPVNIELLGMNVANLTARAPSGQSPVMAFALRVTNARMPSQTIAHFNKAVMLTITSPNITAGSEYYNLTASGSLALNSTGLKVKAEQLSHPIIVDGVAWVVTSPAAAPAAK
jgi:predicted lipoprotein with Yx(FWY)xxD motif